MAIERHGETEEMRHVPPLDFLLDHVSGELRFRVDTLFNAALQRSNSLPPPIDEGFRSMIRWLDRLSDVLRHHRPNGPEGDLRARIDRAFQNATHALSSADRNLFRRRSPFHLFERSRGEQAFAAMLAAFRSTDRLVSLVADIDPDIRLKLMEKYLPPIHE
ncbi:MAG TPA: hypothetical protein VIL97_01750, partial [Thermoanaerobaculia bacterium]